MIGGRNDIIQIQSLGKEGKDMDFYVGTYTSLGGEGLLCCALEGDRIVRHSVLRGLTDPIWVLRLPGSGRAFASGRNGWVAEFIPERGCLKQRACVSSGGSDCCFLTADPTEKYLYSANYEDGSVSVFPIGDSLGERVFRLLRRGRGPDDRRQQGPHVHQTVFIPGTDLMAVCDLGTDEIVTCRTEPGTGILTELGSIRLFGGPRHLVFTSAGTACLIHELSSQVSLLSVREGVFTLRQTLSTLPEDYTGENWAAAIRLSADGKTLYCSNRGHGSLARFGVDRDGLLSPQGWIPMGSWPRDFQPLPDGRFLAADQERGVLLTDPEGRVLDVLQQPGAVCIAPEPNMK